MKFKTLFASLCFLIISSTANAGLIGYELDSETGHIVNESQSLEYLHFDATNGMTISEALNTFSSDGWTIATDKQAARLIVDAANLYESYYERIVSHLSIGGYSNDYSTDPFGDLFGYTFYSSGGTTDVNGWTVTDDTDEERVTFRFGDVDDNYYSVFSVSGHYKEYGAGNPDYIYHRFGSIGIAYNHTNSSSVLNGDDYGRYGAVLLVRATEVPEPSSLAIFSAALLGLLRLRKMS